MNNWMTLQIQNLLLFETDLKEEEIIRIINSMKDLLAHRRYAIVPQFLSDEMYNSVKESNLIGFTEASKIYMSSLKGYLDVHALQQPSGSIEVFNENISD